MTVPSDTDVCAEDAVPNGQRCEGDRADIKKQRSPFSHRNAIAEDDIQPGTGLDAMYVR